MALPTLDHRTVIHPDALELAELLRPSWAPMSAELHLSGVPLCKGDPDPDPDPDLDPDPDPDPDKDPEPGKDPDKDDPDKVKPDDDWKTKARKNETRAKREERKRREAEAELQKLRDKDKSETERAIEKAREEARNEALTEAEKERRADRLEVAVTRAAARGVTVGEGDDAKNVKFADPEDALLRVEKRVRDGVIDGDELYDDQGKVNTDLLADALAEIASDYPHLVGGNGERPKPAGDPDSRKGDPAQKDLESMTPEDHAKRKYGDNKSTTVPPPRAPK